jgi:ATP-dependent protease ClpP protease subunit
MGECFCPQDLKGLLEGVDENEPLEVEITSEGGSVFAGIQIANMLARH